LTHIKVIDLLFSDHYRGEPMDTTAIYVVPDENFDDWVVRDESGHELGHYPTREAAEGVARGTAGASLSFASLTGAQPAKDSQRGEPPGGSPKLNKTGSNIRLIRFGHIGRSSSGTKSAPAAWEMAK
jgi:hypothetical protein